MRHNWEQRTIDGRWLKWIEDSGHNHGWQVAVTLLCGSGVQPQISDGVKEEEVVAARMAGRGLAAMVMLLAKEEIGEGQRLWLTMATSSRGMRWLAVVIEESKVAAGEMGNDDVVAGSR
ncbi:hypothetical protein BHE74_00037907 [Ensete ventricosum]|nr:hypothetical protein BHE74_00037907 [Ensete ventricosum]RZS23526.1 hypothetical protein BHM03_00056474 [Ensete ventricosum]